MDGLFTAQAPWLRTVGDSMYERALRGGWLDRPAVIDEIDGTVYTHRTLYRCSATVAAELAGRGVSIGDPVAILVGERAEWFISFLALARLGAIAVLLNSGLDRQVHRRGLAAAGARHTLDWHDGGVVLVGPQGRDRIFDLPGVTARCAVEPMPDHPDLAAVPDDRDLYIQFTSGTAGESKAITHRASHLADYQQAVGRNALGLTKDDVLLSISRLHCAYGFNNEFVYPMLSGCAVVLNPEHRRPEAVVRAIKEHAVTIVCSMPSALGPLAHHLHGAKQSVAVLDSVRAVVSAGERLPVELGAELHDLFAAPVLEQIWCTEVGNAFCANGIDAASADSVGFPCPGYDVEVRVPSDPRVAEAFAVEGHRPGEVWVRGRTIAEFATTVRGAVQLLSDGWLRTGDVGYWNASGALVVLGRADDIVRTGGISVSAIEIERRIAATGLVRDVAVVSVRDDSSVDRLVVFVVPAGTWLSTKVFSAVLSSRLSSQLECYHIPRKFEVCDVLPRTPSGKIMRQALRALAEAAAKAMRNCAPLQIQ
ncbi:class I adenylate-forming enzyme family protein [Nocardia sp. CA-128927]|uniref:class I adenylate-forming enzyme family protein n=1 Tax=Nocardia sp. CA-128927 TaxID=3239975 RepID=UPI003D98A4B4